MNMTKDEIFEIDKVLDSKSKKDSLLIEKRGYYVYYNKPNKHDRHLMIHHHTCGNCCFGIGKFSEAEAGLNGIWIGPSETIESLKSHMNDIFGLESELCRCCQKK